MVGLPAAGKSTLAQEIADYVPTYNFNCSVVEVDAIFKEMNQGQPIDGLWS